MSQPWLACAATLTFNPIRAAIAEPPRPGGLHRAKDRIGRLGEPERMRTRPQQARLERSRVGAKKRVDERRSKLTNTTMRSPRLEDSVGRAKVQGISPQFFVSPFI